MERATVLPEVQEAGSIGTIWAALGALLILGLALSGSQRDKALAEVPSVELSAPARPCPTTGKVADSSEGAVPRRGSGRRIAPDGEKAISSRP